MSTFIKMVVYKVGRDRRVSERRRRPASGSGLAHVQGYPAIPTYQMEGDQPHRLQC